MKSKDCFDSPAAGKGRTTGMVATMSRSLLGAALSAVVLAISPIASGASSQFEALPQAVAVQSAAVNLDEAVRIVRSRTGARVVRAETRVVGRRRIHFVRIVTDSGRVRTLRVDAATGELL
jgi:uncharacterized membrane protein YkoI